MDDLEYLSVSDGTGDAALMHVTASRLAGATTLLVDTVANVPAKFIATVGTLLSTGFIDPSTKIDFKGHLDSGHLVIDGLEPGSSDTGNDEGQVVVIKPNSGWANRVAEALQGVLAAVYPVGCIYTTTNGANPSTVLGFGTWTAFGAGRVIVGNGTSDASFSAGATGGASRHTLTIPEMPIHRHQLGFDPTHGYAAGTPMSYTIGASSGGFGTLSDRNPSGYFDSNLIGYTGDGSSHNNLQPYIVAYFWKRTA